MLPLLVAFVSTALLAYILIFPDQSDLFSLLRRQAPEKPIPQDVQREQTAPTPPQEAAQQQPTSPDTASEDLGPRLPMPRDDKLLMMIMSSLIALNQANTTGNYAVLREMAAPAFKKVNTVERLTEIFQKLRARNLDLSPLLLYQPKLFRRPEMNEEGVIRVSGFFPTTPERVNFELMFQPVRGQWRLFGIAVQTSPAPPPTAPARSEEAPKEEEAKPTDGPSAAPKATKDTKAEPAKPPASPVKKPAPKPEATQEKQAPAAEDQTDIRDRIEAPRPPDKSKPKPKPKTGWNPFGR